MPRIATDCAVFRASRRDDTAEKRVEQIRGQEVEDYGEGVTGEARPKPREE